MILRTSQIAFRKGKQFSLPQKSAHAGKVWTHAGHRVVRVLRRVQTASVLLQLTSTNSLDGSMECNMECSMENSSMGIRSRSMVVARRLVEILRKPFFHPASKESRTALRFVWPLSTKWNQAYQYPRDALYTNRTALSGSMA